ncbi:ATP-binding protein [Streptosporangium fragile]|uniref:ATP-binding protein n=1 Tax=Streptosporangium fragile TaxID=46186 RepID=UPI0031E5C701
MILITGLAFAAGDAWLAARWGTYDTLFYGKELLQLVVWLVAGFLVGRVRPRTPMGTLMMLLGLLLAADAPAAFALVTDSTLLRLLVAAALLLTALQLPLGAHIFLAYPSGTVRDAMGRAVMRAGYLFGGLSALVLVVVGPPEPQGRCRDVCAPMRLVDSPALSQAAAQVLALGTAALVLVGGTVIVRRFVHAGHRERRVLAFPAVAMVATALLWAVVNLQSAAAPSINSEQLHSTLSLAQFAALVAVPAAFFLGLLRERLDEARVSDLVRQIAVMPTDRLEPALAAALGDPHLRVAFPVPGGYVDASGRSMRLPEVVDARRTTPVGDPLRPVAVLLHDPSLRTEPALLEAVSATAHLALENARLQAAVRAQLAEVRASRARLVAAGDEARRRLERDLHDGAQQRMLSAGLALNLLRQDLAGRRTGPETMELLGEAEAELHAATRELRELARGIHPAVLTIQGLRAALEQLVLRAAAPVALRADDLPRLGQAVEATAYFVVSEALTNAVRHARAARVDVTTALDAGRLVVRVADDGVGGASLTPGSGLAGLADRVAAVDGVFTLHSPPGEGTVLTVDLPCD